MPFQPAIDEPSNAWPLSNLSITNCLAGTETCCSLPRVSVKRRSTNLTSFSLSILRTSAGLVMRISLLAGAGLRCIAKRAGSSMSENYAIPDSAETPGSRGIRPHVGVGGIYAPCWRNDSGSPSRMVQSRLARQFAMMRRGNIAGPDRRRRLGGRPGMPMSLFHIILLMPTHRIGAPSWCGCRQSLAVTDRTCRADSPPALWRWRR